MYHLRGKKSLEASCLAANNIGVEKGHSTVGPTLTTQAMELRALAGRRIRFTSVKSGRRSIGRVRAVDDVTLTVESEFIDSPDFAGQVVVETLLPSHLLVLTGEVSILKPGVCRILVTKTISATPSPNLEFLRIPPNVEFSLPSRKSARATLVAAGNKSFALETTSVIPLGKFIEFSINDDGRLFSIEAPVSGTVDRGKMKLYFINFDDVPRVINIYWQKLQNSG